MKKTFTFAGIHFFVAFSLAYALTGELVIGGLIALLEPLANTVAFFFHEKAWQHKQKHSVTAVNSGYKTLSFAIVHFSVAFSVIYLLTGDVIIGSAMAMIEPCINTVAYYLHEKVWLRISQTQKEVDEATLQASIA